MKKGLYTGLVSIILITALAVSAVYLETKVDTMKQRTNLQATEDLRFYWFNAAYLLDKAAADAIADAKRPDSMAACEAAPDYTTKVQEYFSKVTSIISEETGNPEKPQLAGIDCKYVGTFDVRPETGDPFSFDLACTKRVNPGGVDEFSVQYKQTVTIEKTISVVGAPCQVTVTDDISGIVEVNDT